MLKMTTTTTTTTSFPRNMIHVSAVKPQKRLSAVFHRGRFLWQKGVPAIRVHGEVCGLCSMQLTINCFFFVFYEKGKLDRLLNGVWHDDSGIKRLRPRDK